MATNTHILECSAPELLPFARSRLKAMRATGLEYVSQKFDVNGSTVSVRIAGDQEFISVSRGRGYLWVRLAYSDASAAMWQSGYVATIKTKVYRVRLPDVELDGTQKVEVRLWYEGQSVSGVHSFVHGVAPAVRRIWPADRCLYGLTQVAVIDGGGFGSHRTALYAGIKIAKGESKVSSIVEYATSSIPGALGSMVVPWGVFNDYTLPPFEVGGDLYFTEAFNIASTADVNLNWDTSKRLKMNSSGKVDPAPEWAPILSNLSGGAGFPFTARSPSDPKFTDAEVGAVNAKHHAWISMSGYVARRVYDRRGNLIRSLPDEATPVTPDSWIHRKFDTFSSMNIAEHYLSTDRSGVIASVKAYDLRDFPGVTDDPLLMELLDRNWNFGVSGVEGPDAFQPAGESIGMDSFTKTFITAPQTLEIETLSDYTGYKNINAIAEPP